MDEREAARRDRAATLVATAQKLYCRPLSTFAVDTGEQIFTDDEDGIWVRGWMLVAMEERLPELQKKGYEGPDLSIEQHEQEIFVGTKGRFTGTWIRCWLRIPVDQGDEDDEHGSD